MIAEEIISEIEKNNMEIRKLQKINDVLTEGLKQRKNEDWDWVSVKVAANFLDVSSGMIYARINGGKLEVKRIGSKTFVRMSEIKAINDKYEAV